MALSNNQLPSVIPPAGPFYSYLNFRVFALLAHSRLALGSELSLFARTRMQGRLAGIPMVFSFRTCREPGSKLRPQPSVDCSRPRRPRIGEPPHAFSLRCSSSEYDGLRPGSNPKLEQVLLSRPAFSTSVRCR